MSRYIGALPSTPIDDTDHFSIRTLLPEYVTLLVLRQQPPLAWRSLELHLARCPSCRSEADTLQELMTDAYQGMLEPVPTPSPPDLSFLGLALAPGDRGGSQSTGPEPIGQVVIQFSAALLASMRVRMVARSHGLQLRYAYRIPALRPTDPDVTVEVLTRDEQPERGLVRVCVECAESNPFDQAGTEVTLLAGDVPYKAITDTQGLTQFPDVLLDQIERWQITIVLPSTAMGQGSTIAFPP